jgi:hypothetical protein
MLLKQVEKHLREQAVSPAGFGRAAMATLVCVRTAARA